MENIRHTTVSSYTNASRTHKFYVEFVEHAIDVVNIIEKTFLNSLTISSLKQKISFIQSALQAISTVPKRINILANLVQTIETFTNATTVTPNSPATVLTVSQIWSSVGKLQSHVQCTDMENSVTHMIIMWSYLRAYEWIQAIFNASINSTDSVVYWHTALINALTQEFNDHTQKKKGL